MKILYDVIKVIPYTAKITIAEGVEFEQAKKIANRQNYQTVATLSSNINMQTEIIIIPSELNQ